MTYKHQMAKGLTINHHMVNCLPNTSDKLAQHGQCILLHSNDLTDCEALTLANRAFTWTIAMAHWPPVTGMGFLVYKSEV